jgi:hypothetical protein
VTEEDWRITTSSSLARLEAQFANLALRYEELSQTARDASVAKGIAQQNALCLDEQHAEIMEIRDHMRRHEAAADNLMRYSEHLVAIAEEDQAWRRVRARIVSASKWLTVTGAGVVLLYEVAVHGPRVAKEIADAIEKALP